MPPKRATRTGSFAKSCKWSDQLLSAYSQRGLDWIRTGTLGVCDFDIPKRAQRTFKSESEAKGWEVKQGNNFSSRKALFPDQIAEIYAKLSEEDQKEARKSMEQFPAFRNFADMCIRNALSRVVSKGTASARLPKAVDEERFLPSKNGNYIRNSKGYFVITSEVKPEMFAFERLKVTEWLTDGTALAHRKGEGLILLTADAVKNLHSQKSLRNKQVEHKHDSTKKGTVESEVFRCDGKDISGAGDDCVKVKWSGKKIAVKMHLQDLRLPSEGVFEDWMSHEFQGKRWRGQVLALAESVETTLPETGPATASAAATSAAPEEEGAGCLTAGSSIAVRRPAVEGSVMTPSAPETSPSSAAEACACPAVSAAPPNTDHDGSPGAAPAGDKVCLEEGDEVRHVVQKKEGIVTEVIKQPGEEVKVRVQWKNGKTSLPVLAKRLKKLDPTPPSQQQDDIQKAEAANKRTAMQANLEDVAEREPKRRGRGVSGEGAATQAIPTAPPGEQLIETAAAAATDKLPEESAVSTDVEIPAAAAATDKLPEESAVSADVEIPPETAPAPAQVMEEATPMRAEPSEVAAAREKTELIVAPPSLQVDGELEQVADDAKPKIKIYIESTGDKHVILAPPEKTLKSVITTWIGTLHDVPEDWLDLSKFKFENFQTKKVENLERKCKKVVTTTENVIHLTLLWRDAEAEEDAEARREMLSSLTEEQCLVCVMADLSGSTNSKPSPTYISYPRQESLGSLFEAWKSFTGVDEKCADIFMNQKQLQNDKISLGTLLKEGQKELQLTFVPRAPAS